MNKVVLILTDESGTRQLIRIILERQGYTCFDAATGQEALELLRTHPVSLLIQDINRPSDPLEGSAFVGTLQSDPQLRSIPVIIASSTSQDRAAAKFRESGVDFEIAIVAYVRLPFHHRVLVATVEEIIGGGAAN
jgi:CheY-like chemotaxis protein